MLKYLGFSEEKQGVSSLQTLISGLRVVWEQVKAKVEPDASGARADPDPRLTEILRLGEQGATRNSVTYADANEAELRIVAHLDRIALEAKGQANLSRATRLAVYGVEDFRTEFASARADSTPEGELKLRAVVSELLAATHVRYADRRSNRNARKDASLRMIYWAGLVVLVPLLAAWLMYTFDKPTVFRCSGDACEEFTFFDMVGKYHLMALLYCGWVGAIFSRLIAFQGYPGEMTYEEVDRNYRSSIILVRICIGGIAAFVVYYMIAGDLIAGELFPDLKDQNFGVLWNSWLARGVGTVGAAGNTAVPLCPATAGSCIAYTMPAEGFAKLVIWCFLAGFSERFIPDRLDQVAAGGSAAVQKN